MERVVALDRITERHPDVSKEDAIEAWSHCIASTPAFEGNPDRYIAIGIDGKGRQIELVAVRKEGGLWLIIHAQYPPQHDIKERLGFGRRKS